MDVPLCFAAIAQDRLLYVGHIGAKLSFAVSIGVPATTYWG